MDFTLHCNTLKCRTQLSDQAVVTTCSHIFCLPCATTLGLSNADSISRVCPACNAQLSNQDDCAITNLSPTEDYKTSVLSGLNPSIIIECASRAMAFWTYQTTQEIFYQEFLMKSMTEKYQSLSGQMDKLIANANTEVSGLREKLQSMVLNCENLSQKNQQLTESYKKKCKDNNQLHKLYNQAKQKHATEIMAEAAREDVSHLTRQLGGEFRPGAHAHHGLSDQNKSRSDGSSVGRYRGGRITLATSHKQGLPPILQTGDVQRAHLPTSQQNSGHFFGNHLRNDSLPSRIGTPLRQPLGEFSTNLFGGQSLANGMNQAKKSHRHLQRGSIDVPFARDRVAFGRL